MNEYLKDFKAMTPKEQLDWLSDFTHWSNNKLPILCAIGNAWEAAHIKSMEDGLRLISAFGYCRDFIDKSLLFRDFARRIERMNFYVEKIKKEVAAGRFVKTATGDTIAEVPPVQPRRRGRPTKAETEARKSAEAPAPVEQQPQAVSVPQSDFAAALALSNGEARLHLDQLAWLMSDGLKLRIKEVAGLRAVAAKEAEQAKALADNGVPQAIIEPHSRAAVEAKDKYLAIYAEVDKELGELYSFLYIGGEHIPAWEKRCTDRGITLDQLRAILKPYWEKEGCPTVQLESVTESLSDETEEEKKSRQARLHSIRTYFMRKDTKLTLKRIDKMKDLIAEVRGYGYPTEEYEAVLAASEKELEPKD